MSDGKTFPFPWGLVKPRRKHLMVCERCSYLKAAELLPAGIVRDDFGKRLLADSGIPEIAASQDGWYLTCDLCLGDGNCKAYLPPAQYRSPPPLKRGLQMLAKLPCGCGFVRYDKWTGIDPRECPEHGKAFLELDRVVMGR